MFSNIMNNLTNLDKNSRFLLVIIAIISFLLLLIFVINFFTGRKEKKILKEQKKYKKRLIEEINKEAKTIEPVEKVKVNNINIEEPEEILDVEEEILEVLQEDGESDVDRILREIKDASKEESINLTEFEREQEETAIISYDELCKRAGVKKKIYKTNNEVVEKAIDEVTKVENKKYKPSRIVSPIYGVQEEKKTIKVEENIDLDQTFLQNLKEFRSSLD